MGDLTPSSLKARGLPAQATQASAVTKATAVTRVTAVTKATLGSRNVQTVDFGREKTSFVGLDLQVLSRFALNYSSPGLSGDGVRIRQTAASSSAGEQVLSEVVPKAARGSVSARGFASTTCCTCASPCRLNSGTPPAQNGADNLKLRIDHVKWDSFDAWGLARATCFGQPFAPHGSPHKQLAKFK